MRWIKKGLLFPAPFQPEWAVSHAALPIAESLGGDRWQVFFSARDARNRSSVGCFELEVCAPEQLVRTVEYPVLSPGGLGAFDEAGATGAWSVTAGVRTCLHSVQQWSDSRSQRPRSLFRRQPLCVGREWPVADVVHLRDCVELGEWTP